MPWSLRDGGREGRGWLSPEVPGEREVTRRGREGPEVDPVGGEPTITSTACSGPGRDQGPHGVGVLVGPRRKEVGNNEETVR